MSGGDWSAQPIPIHQGAPPRLFTWRQLLHYRDTTRNGTSDVNSPAVIGNDGWQRFSQLSYGGKKILYAVVGQ